MNKLRWALLFVVIISILAHGQQTPAKCQSDVEAMTTAVIQELFIKDPLYKGFDPNADVYLRIIDEPHWDDLDDSYYQIRLVKERGKDLSRDLVVKYTIPKGSRSIYRMINKALVTSPCLSALQLAAKLPIKRTQMEMTDEVRTLAEKVFDLNVQPAHLAPNVVRLDATMFTLEVIGDYRLRVSSDDHELEFVRWIIDLENAIDAKH